MPTEPRNTYLFRWGQSFVPRCPIDHRLKKIYFFPPVQFVRNGSPCEWKTTFSDVPFFFSSSLSNELFFIRRQRYAISPLLSSSSTSILSRTFSSSSLFLFSFTIFHFSPFFLFPPLFFDSSSSSPSPLAFSRPPRISSAVGQPFAFIFLHAVLPFVVSSPHLHPLNSIVRFFSFFRDRFLRSSPTRTVGFSPSQFYHIFTLTLTRSLPSLPLPLPLPHEFFSPRFYEFSDHFFPSLSVQLCSILVLRFKR